MTTGLMRKTEQEPVAWQVMVEDEAMKEFSVKDVAHDWCVQQKLSGSIYVYWIRPLYTSPPKRHPLEKREIMNALMSVDPETKRLAPGFEQFARAIEAAHGIKEQS